MAIWRFVEFPVKQAWRLSDLSGVSDDLEATESYCERYLKEAKKKRPDVEIGQALCAAALVAFGRAFASGVRAGVPKELVDALPSRLAGPCAEFRALRDKWIAHSVNAMEENRVVAYLTPPERGPKQVHSVSVQRHRVLTLTPETMRTLREVSASLRHALGNVIDDEKTKVLAYARSLAVDPFYEARDTYQPFPRSTNPTKARSRA